MALLWSVMEADSPGYGVVLIDAQPLFRVGIERACEEWPGVSILASVGNAREGVAAVQRLQPSVALVDLHLPGARGLAFVRSLIEKSPGLQVVVMSTERDGPAVYEALAAGVAGCLTKDPDRWNFVTR